jgi:hypothetical protein
MNRRKADGLIMWLLAAGLVSAVGFSEACSSSDAGTDAGTDTGTDAGTDAGADAGTATGSGGTSGPDSSCGGAGGCGEGGAIGTTTGAGGSPCPGLEEDPLSLIGDPCATGDQECPYGEECCCGQCYSLYECSCAQGIWMCSFTDACLDSWGCGGISDGGVGPSP